MNVAVLTSNSLRHKYFTNVIKNNFNLCAYISEPKTNYYSRQIDESDIVELHFNNLRKIEVEFFRNNDFPDLPNIQLSKDKINSDYCINWIIDHKIDYIFLYGTAILNDKWLSIFKDRIINLHLGLSPFYRGAATLFWPFYNEEITCVGATVHVAAEKVDSGDIISRIKPDLEIGDDYYSINYKTIKKAIDTFPEVVKKYFNSEIDLISQNINSGKVYKKSDFNEKALTKVLNYIGKGILENHLIEIENNNRCSC